MSELTQLAPTLTINEIVARYPEAIAVFDRFGFDTCCGGGITVDEAARRDGVDASAVLGALRDVLDRK
jgi:iron-sulfur cluster repair protein YtfE (RIC family)